MHLTAREGTRRTKQVMVRALAATGALAVSGVLWTPGLVSMATAASTDTGGCGSNSAGSTLAGSSATLESLGAQVAFNLLPGPLPLSGNLVESDLSFARTTVSNGPQMTVQAAPFYPGDIAANLGSLLSSDGVPFSVPNDPLQAFASYPASPAEPENSSFPSGLTLPAGLAIQPNVATAQAHAGPDAAKQIALDATAVATLNSLTFGTGKAPPLSIGTIQSTNAAVPGASCFTAAATSIVKGIDIGGLVDIASINSVASAQSDGNTSQPTATLQVGQVTVAGMSAYVDNQGVHISDTDAPIDGITPQQMQVTVDNTLAQDGISLRLLNPTTTTNIGNGSASSGALVITLNHAIDIPYIPGEPQIPIPVLGKESLPSGIYQVVTTVTLGSTEVDANAVATQALGSGVGSGGVSVGGSTLPNLTPSLSSGLGGTIGGVSSVGVPTGPGVSSPIATAAPTSGKGIVHRLLSFHVPGLPSVPVGWFILGILLCVIFTYLMLMVAWAQLLKGRK
jgi:hypothetical protein